jgi:Uma2 family endonuclease
MLPLLRDSLPASSPAILALDQEALEQKALEQEIIFLWENEADNEQTLYPQSDGKPMAEGTEQYDWIVMIKENLEILFTHNPKVFIAADLLWYPVPVPEEIPPAVIEPPSVRSQAPDVMAIFDRPKGKRRSYLQWQEKNIPPQVVFEILSHSNRSHRGMKEMQTKFTFYQTHGVEEYYIYDPKAYKLQGWLRQGQLLEPISNLSNWTSPKLGIRFVVRSRKKLEIYYPDGRKFLSSPELAAQVEQAQQQADIAQRQAEIAQQQAQATTSQLQQTAMRLVQSGMPKPQVAEMMSLSQEQINTWL